MIELLLILQLSTKTADDISDAMIAAQITAEAIQIIRHKDYKCGLLRNGINIGSNILVKELVRKQRLDKSDFKSYYSMHSSTAMSNIRWNFKISVPVAVTIGSLRVKARKHDWIDVFSGFGAGLLSNLICDGY